MRTTHDLPRAKCLPMQIVPIISVLLVMTLGLLITRVASAALVWTGLSKDLARFQARSAFTGCGFTTTEAESIVNHPVRRRIVMSLMLLGNVGIVGAVVSMVPVVSQQQGKTVLDFFSAVALLALGIAALYAVSRSKTVDQLIGSATRWALNRFTAVEVQDYHSLLHFSDGFSVTEVEVPEEHWMAGKNLVQMQLTKEGVQVLGIMRRSGSYIGTPTAATFVRAGDTVVVYGRGPQLEYLCQRKAGPPGDAEHRWCVEGQAELLSTQSTADARAAGGGVPQPQPKPMSQAR